ncbi:exported protein of unknown function [Ralstonia solanacearum PSI07]|nr:exported protein of unknown function [Ralstonia solanacearum PSI07]
MPRFPTVGSGPPANAALAPGQLLACGEGRDLRSVWRVAPGRQGQPSAVIPDGRTLQSTCEID